MFTLACFGGTVQFRNRTGLQHGTRTHLHIRTPTALEYTIAIEMGVVNCAIDLRPSIVHAAMAACSCVTGALKLQRTSKPYQKKEGEFQEATRCPQEEASADEVATHYASCCCSLWLTSQPRSVWSFPR